MEKRKFGRTGHLSTVAVLGACCFASVSQKETDASMEKVIAAGINHIDVAPSYGHAEDRLGPWMARERSRFFLGCKTTQRSKTAAAADLAESLKRLHTDCFDLYQLHGITTFAELDEVTAPDGALQAILEARKSGVVKATGITGHGMDAPAIFLEALRRFDFDSVLFPINFILYADPIYRRNSEKLLAECRKRNVGTMIIKAIARGGWDKQTHRYTCWYEPFDDPEMVQQAVNFVLSQDVTALCTVCDNRLVHPVIQACQSFIPLTAVEQEALIGTAGAYGNPFLPLG